MRADFCGVKNSWPMPILNAVPLVRTRINPVVRVGLWLSCSGSGAKLGPDATAVTRQLRKVAKIRICEMVSVLRA
jgi:hypothetical protein